jgi:hypothetical protein
MPTVYAANQSSLKVGEDTIEGVRAIEYRSATVRQNLYAIGSRERIGVISGGHSVEGRIRVASASAKLDGLGDEEVFQMMATFGGAGDPVIVSFQDCMLTEKTFDLSAGAHGEAVYSFTAVRMTEGE